MKLTYPTEYNNKKTSYSIRFRQIQNKIRVRTNRAFIYLNILMLAFAVVFIVIFILQSDRFIFITRIYGIDNGYAGAKIYFQSNKTFIFYSESCTDNFKIVGKYEINMDTVRLISEVKPTRFKIKQKKIKLIADFKYLAKGSSIEYIFNKSDTIQYKKGIHPIFISLNLKWE